MSHTFGVPCPVCGTGSLYRLRVCGPCWSTVPPNIKRRLARLIFGSPAFDAELARVAADMRAQARVARGA